MNQWIFEALSSSFLECATAFWGLGPPVVIQYASQISTFYIEITQSSHVRKLIQIPDFAKNFGAFQLSFPDCSPEIS